MKHSIMRFNTRSLLMALLLLFAFNSNAADADPVKGKTLFEQNCQSCHALDVASTGPALRGLHKRPGRSEKWLVSWIKNNNKLRASGDPLANQLFAENDGKVMSLFEQLSDDDIKSILEFIKTAPEPVKAVATNSDEVITEVKEPNSFMVKAINFFIFAIIVALLAIFGYIFDVVSLVSKYTKIKLADANKINAWMMVIFFVVGFSAVVWETIVHGKHVLISDSASLHGVNIDNMLIITTLITGFVFVATHVVLFYFAFKYQHKDGRRAYFYAHNNTIEYVWTIIPAIVLTILVISGFTYWVDITRKAPNEAESIEVFAYQFGWNARYPGKDGKLGPHSFNLISGTNPLGLGVASEYPKLVKEVNESLAINEANLAKMLTIPDPTKDEKKELAVLEEQIRLQKAHLRRLKSIERNEAAFDKSAEDDIIISEIGVVKGRPFEFKFRSRDVIHSAYSPHFRIQMNCVPGIPTALWFQPTISTKEMRNKKNDPKFDYYMYCNKICGSSHYNMKIKITVFDTEVDYQLWKSGLKAAFAPEAPAPTNTIDTSAISKDTTNLQTVN